MYFWEHTQRDERVDLGFWKSKVKDYTEPPPRCFQCQMYRHVAKHCTAPTPRCSLCGNDHDLRSYPNTSPVRCVKCGNENAANFRKGPTSQSAFRPTQPVVSGKIPAPALSGKALKRAPSTAPPTLWASEDFPNLRPRPKRRPLVCRRC